MFGSPFGRPGCWVSDNRNPVWFLKSRSFSLPIAVLHHHRQRYLQFLWPKTYFFFLPPFLPLAAGLSAAALSSPAGAPPLASAFSGPLFPGAVAPPGAAALSAAPLAAPALCAAALSLAAFSAASILL